MVMVMVMVMQAVVVVDCVGNVCSVWVCLRLGADRDGAARGVCVCVCIIYVCVCVVRGPCPVECAAWPCVEKVRPRGNPRVFPANSSHRIGNRKKTPDVP
jgi:hypothetical protein